MFIIQKSKCNFASLQDSAAVAKPLFGKSDCCICPTQIQKNTKLDKISDTVVAESFAHNLLNAFVIHLLSSSTDRYGTHNCRRAHGTTGLGAVLILQWVPCCNANEIPGTWRQSLNKSLSLVKVVIFKKLVQLPPQELPQQT